MFLSLVLFFLMLPFAALLAIGLLYCGFILLGALALFFEKPTGSEE